MAEENSRDEIRKDIVEDLETSVRPKKAGELLLAVSLILGTFGSAAVLMPEESSLTGDFSGALTVDSPEIQSSDIRMIDSEDGDLRFFLDSEIHNPNAVDARLDSVAYRVYGDSEVVKRGSFDFETSVDSQNSEMIALEFKIDKEDLVSKRKSFTESTEDMRVEGVMRFDSGGEVFDRYFEREFSAY